MFNDNDIQQQLSIKKSLDNKNLLKYNLGYIGILGLLALVILSYTTIFFTKHGYVHNLIVHAAGLISFAFFFCKLKLNKNIIKNIWPFYLLLDIFFINNKYKRL